jgi:phosphatidyl-myo-inositol dimannoside synthase
VASLLVTNDFPPKIGGIQSYLYELWRRLPPGDTTVLTTPYEGAARWDAAQPFRVVRTREGWLLPTPDLTRRVDALAREVGAAVIFLDPMLPLGLVGPRLRSAPYVVVVHGAEITVPGRLPGSRQLAGTVLRHAAGIVAAGEYPAREATRAAGRPVPALVLPPGVDPSRFRPLDPAERRATRERLGLDPDAPLVVGVSRLVPRKGFDAVLDAVGGLPGVHVAIAGAGRDRGRLERRARPLGGRVHFLGRVPDADLPALYACADVFAMLCHDRWGGLEAEGFGIVFVEAAACGVPAVAGRSGGSHEAVVDGETGVVVDGRDVDGARRAIAALLADDGARARMGTAARARAAGALSYDVLAARLAPLAAGDIGVLARAGVVD